jgi:dihydropteroate synthase
MIPAFSPFTLNCRGRLISLETPAVMGILNVTPDSFHTGNRFGNEAALLERAEKMLSEGADFLDIGGYSTRPGAADISPEEEIRRVAPIITALARRFPEAVISVDTFRASVARQAVDAGAAIINDVSGGLLDETMYETVASLQVPYILMHMRGTPQTMAGLNQYRDLVPDILDELHPKIARLRELGVKDLVVDPGFGFAKNADQNYQLLRQADALHVFGIPLLIGISRKSMIWKKLGIPPEEALNGTTVLNTIALQKGAHILRVHDVREARETIRILGWLGG